MTNDDSTKRLHREIDENLKRAYDDVLNQAIPKEFDDLLARLRAGDAPQAGLKGGENG